MNMTRIEVPLTLPAPHFDDEATIATARQVVPIERARVRESWRKLRAILPLLLAAMLCGALGATVVNYYERKPNEQPRVQQSAPNGPAVQAISEPSPAAVAVSSNVTSQPDATQSASTSQQTSANTNEQPAKADEKSTQADDNVSEKTSPKAEKQASSDPSKLIRKRRVQPDQDAPKLQKNGAGRIADIFSGPNP
ncbi:MAG TPA: hypothetical protein VGJ69_01170 [Pyrinomonadaceae bacterium]|jgi:hypothetical protein